ncbi:MAG: MlaD family protein [Bacteroidales bacterium]|jgi:phospholipid/cholesterol/gamma-HCH transport system substrate-binding protein|nr:MlaD family protein [Bacteroidales bacterium]
MKTDKIINVGLLVVLLLAILFWGLNFLKGRNVFSKENTFYVVYEDINGLEKNTGVYLRGFKIGQVRDIRFMSSAYDRLIVELAINSDVIIPQNTVARIFSSDIMGTKAIDLIFPEVRTAYNLQSRDTLVADVEGGIIDQVRLEIAPYKVHIDNIMESAISTIEQLKLLINKNTAESIHQSIIALQGTIVAVQHAANSADNILSSNAENMNSILSNVNTFSQTLSNNTETLNRAIANLDVFADSLSQANVHSLINNAEATAAQLQELTTRINNGEGTLGALMKNDQLYTNLENTSAQLNKLIIDIQKNPKRYVSFPIFGGGGKNKNEVENK